MNVITNHSAANPPHTPHLASSDITGCWATNQISMVTPWHFGKLIHKRVEALCHSRCQVRSRHLLDGWASVRVSAQCLVEVRKRQKGKEKERYGMRDKTDRKQDKTMRLRRDLKGQNIWTGATHHTGWYFKCVLVCVCLWVCVAGFWSNMHNFSTSLLTVVH